MRDPKECDLYDQVLGNKETSHAALRTSIMTGYKEAKMMKTFVFTDSSQEDVKCDDYCSQKILCVDKGRTNKENKAVGQSHRCPTDGRSDSTRLREAK